jgi:hypothetical protein
MGETAMHRHYLRFLAMVGTATGIMLGLTYLNSYRLDHVLWSETRLYMALIMGSTMTVVMWLFMREKFTNRRLNIAILAGSTLVFAISLYLVRSQATVGQISWMRAMIPHHSIAILTSERAELSDPRVRRLADQIIDSQRSEIEEMKALIAELEKR